jgi:thioredoxin 1
MLNVNDSNFDSEVLQSDLPILIDFWAPWCGPCKVVAPFMDDLAKDYAGRIRIVKFNVDEGKEFPSKFNVKGIPTLMVFRDGKPVIQLTGAVPKSAIQDMLNKVVKGDV